MAMFDSKKEAIFIAVLTGLSFIGLFRAVMYEKPKTTECKTRPTVIHDTITVHDTVFIQYKEIIRPVVNSCIDSPLTAKIPITQYEIDHWQ